MIKKLIFIVLGIILLAGCKDSTQKDYALSDIDIKVIRYDKLQYEATVMNSFLALQKMNTQHSKATKILIEEILELGKVNSNRINEKLCDFYSDTLLVRLMNDALLKYKDMSDIEEQLTEGFKALKRELPSIIIPKVYAQISALNQSVVVSDSLLGFSIDKYMGEDYPLYSKFYYDYQTKSMSVENIVPDCFTFYLIGSYPYNWQEGHRTLFDLMIYRGKIAWTIEKIFNKNMDGQFSLGYTELEAKWCETNKDKIKRWMDKRGYTYSRNPMFIRSYLRNTEPLRYENRILPPSFATWLGMQMVDDFMKTNKDFTIKRLFECVNLADHINQQQSN